MADKKLLELQKLIEGFNKDVAKFVKESKVHVHIKVTTVELDTNLHAPSLKAMVTETKEIG